MLWFNNMVKRTFTGDRVSYIFDGAGGMRDQLEQIILSEMDVKEYPLKRRLEEIKTGGMLFGTKEKCIAVDTDKNHQIIIANTTVGTYLYVALYVAVKKKFILIRILLTLVAIIKVLLGAKPDLFAEHRRNAALATAIAIAESAFKKLELKQCSSGYSGDRVEAVKPWWKLFS